MTATRRKNKSKRIPVGNLIEMEKVILVEKCRKELKICNQHCRKRKKKHQSFGINTLQEVIF